ncbi:MAG: PAS domain S-box protein [Ignavibacteriales bacterium]|nr:PAS domain S-box protein [Ignavibacteriales bacterium]
MKKKKVLIVEDEKIVALDLRSIFLRTGYTVLPDISTAQRAIETALNERPDVILMDIALKGKTDGIAAAHKILQSADIPIIFITANSDPKTLERAKTIDPYGYILKPFDERDVRTIVEMAIYKHRTERELKEQQRWLNTTLRSIGDAVIATDKQGNVKFMNNIAESLTGWKEEDAIGRKLQDVFIVENEDTGKRLPNPVAKVLKERKPLSVTNHTILVSKNGTRTYIEDSAAPILGDDGDIIGVVLTFRDVNEKRRTQDALNVSEKRFRALIEKSTEGITVLDATGAIKYTTGASTPIVGYMIGELTGKNVFEFIHPEELERDKKLLDQLMQVHGKVVHQQIRFKHKDGSWRWLEITGTNLLKDPAINGIVVNFRDVTYRKEAEEKLSHINQRLSLISRVTGEVIGWLPIQKQVREMAEQVQHAFQVDAVVVRIIDNAELHLLAGIGVPHNQLLEKIPLHYGIADQIMKSRRAVAYKDVRENFATMMLQQKAAQEISKYDFISYAGAPLLIGHTVIGIIGLFTHTRSMEFTPTDLEHLQIVANHIAVAVANNRLFREVREQNIELTQHIEEQKKAEQLLRVSEERYRAFVEQSSEGIYRTSFVQPIPVDLPVDEQVQLMFERSYIAECNAVMAKMYGFDSIHEAVGKKIRDMLVESDQHNIDYMKTFIRKGYKFFDEESHERDKEGAVKYFMNNGIGIIENGMWLGVWGTQRDITERKLAENALRESEERYRALVEFSPNAIAVHVKGIVQFVNQAALRLMGAVHVDELVGRSVIEFVHPSHRAKVIERISKVYGNEAAPPQEQLWLRMNGTTVEVEVVSIPFMFEGEPAAQVIARDITERKQAEDALRESELRFRSLFENAKDAVFIADTKTGIVIDANAEAEKLLKRPRTEIIGMHQTDIHPPDRIDEALSLFREQILTLGEHPVEFEVINSDGERIPIEIKASIIRLDDNRIVAQGIFRDITERKASEEALRRSEEKYRSLFEESKDGIYISTYYGKFIDANPAMVELLGYRTKEELLALDIKKDVYYHPADREKLKKAFVNKSYVKDLELSLRRKDGSELNVLLTSTVERGTDGSPLFYSGTVRDVTERKRLEEQLMQAQKMESIGTLAGGIAHDFNNLLAMILGTAELIQQKVSDNPAITTYIKRIIEASERGASISRQLLLFSRPEQSELQPLSASAVIEQLQDFLSHFLPKNIAVKCNIDDKSAVIMGDDGHLHQAFVNLALNAKDAMPNGGTLTLGQHIVNSDMVRKKFPAAEDHQYVALSIQDTGSGIEPHLLQRIFEPFFSTKERGKGTGLGLAIVHGIVQLHHGYIDVESERGSGTQFTMYFPSLAIEIHEDTLEKDMSIHHNSGTILIVDDEEILREILAESLRDEGYDILLASDGYEALKVFHEHQKQVSLVITDLGMPNMGGEQLFDKLKELEPGIKVLVSSGYLDTSSKSELLRKGIKDVLTKPYKFDVIFDTVRRVLSYN